MYGSDGWRGEALIAGKWAAWRPAGGAIALQAGATWSYEPAAPCEGPGAEVRALAGKSFGRTFVNAEAPTAFAAPIVTTGG